VGAAVHGYRAYIIGTDGRIRDRVEFFCESDDDAKQRAQQLVDEHAVELWDEARKVARFEPDKK